MSGDVSRIPKTVKRHSRPLLDNGFIVSSVSLRHLEDSMSLMDKMKHGMDKARGEVSDLAATTKIRHDIGNLNDRKSALFTEIGRQVYALCQQGHAVSEVEAQCHEITTLDEQIKQKSDEIARINAA